MRAAERRAIVDGEMAAATLSVHVDLDAEPIAGELWAPGVAPRAFSGWIEMFASLEELLEAVRAAPATSMEGV